MKSLKNCLPYFLATLLPILAFLTIFQLWKIDLTQPIFSNNNDDALFIFFVIKNVIDSGWFFTNEFVGLPHFTQTFFLHDFPLHAEFFHALIIKFFTYFSRNPFLIANSFFILTFALISASSFMALRSFGIGIFSATLASVLYAFLPYHFDRNLWHLFLSNYSIVPLLAMVTMWISSDRLSAFALNQKNQYRLAPNRLFLVSLAISCFAAMNGVYYAFYGCIIFIFAWLLRGLKNGKFFDKNGFAAVILCAVIFGTLLNLYLPALLNQVEYGFNPSVAGRSAAHSEFFGLKIVNLFLPVENHYFDYFARIRAAFDSFAREGESTAEGLGILISAGFLFLILWLICGGYSRENSFFQRAISKFSLTKKDQSLISDLAGLNLLSVLFATVGGLVMLIAISFPMLRSHARFCVFIAFFSLSAVAIIFDKISEKEIFNQKVFSKILILVIVFLALFDQVGVVSASSIQTEQMRNKFRSDKEFVRKVEESLPQGSAIFILPVYGFPEQGDDYGLLSAYLHSKNLRWSYPVIAGRESAVWQEKIAKLSFEKFLDEIRKAGFSGIYIDRMQMTQYSGEEKGENAKAWRDLRSLEKKLRSTTKKPAIISKDLRLVFFKI